MKRILCMLMAVVAMASLLGGCSSDKKESAYSDATVEVPSTYATYEVSPMTFRFEAGWTGADFDKVQEQIDLLVPALGITSNLCLFTRLVSPAYDKGTVNYLDFGCFQINHEISMEDMEGIMELIDQLGPSIKKLEVSAIQLQASKIRCYGDNVIEALTFCYRVSLSVNDYTINCVEQIALIPVGNKLYTICYSDFTNNEDTDALEQILSSLSIAE